MNQLLRNIFVPDIGNHAYTRQRKLAAPREGTSHLSFHRMHLLIYIAQRFTIASNLRENQASCVIQCCESEGNMIRDFGLQTRGNSNPVRDTFSASEAQVTRRMEPSRAMQSTTYDLGSKVRTCMRRSNPQPHQDPNVPPHLYFTPLALRVPLLARHLSRTSSVMLKG